MTIQLITHQINGYKMHTGKEPKWLILSSNVYNDLRNEVGAGLTMYPMEHDSYGISKIMGLSIAIADTISDVSVLEVR